ncbi:MAG: long-chain fatty acid--CoA ligase [Deltaproteobacteria bacterium]|nr:long-chain fatty acid--CoA ligase [Deltaproteobacteria bacterium]
METRDQTLAQILEQQARRYGSRVFLRNKSNRSWCNHSWSNVADRAARLRTGLQLMGIKAGDRVAILSDNSPEWVIADMAALGLEAIVVPLYPTGGAEETRHVLTDSAARLLAVDSSERLVKIRQLGSLPALETIILLGQGSAAADGAGPRLVGLDQASGDEPMSARPAEPDQLATFIYTSGTSGPAKGVMLSHSNIIANCESNLNALGLAAGDSVLSFLPVAHSFERTAGYYTVMLAGGTISYAEGLTHIAANLLEVEPTVVLTVPRLLEAIYTRIMRTVDGSSALRQRIFRAALAAGIQAADYRHRGRAIPPRLGALMVLFRRLVFDKIRSIFGTRLRYLVSGGAPLSLEVNQLLAAAEIPIVEGYGLTEASPVVACNLHGYTRIGTVGRPLKNIEVRTAADGELLVRGPNIMKGYYCRETDTREAIDDEGWLHTGDIAQIAADGYIRIIDRKKDIVVLSGGKNVSAANLETRLAADPFIAQACVVGDRRKHLAAILVPDFETLSERPPDNLRMSERQAAELVNDRALREFFRGRIREFNRPLSDVERIVDFVLTEQPFSPDNGELTPTMKIRRRAIQEHYQDRIEALYRTAVE